MAEAGLHSMLMETHAFSIILLCYPSIWICHHHCKLVPAPLTIMPTLFQAGREKKGEGWRVKDKSRKKHTSWVSPLNELSQKPYPPYILYYFYFIVPLIFHIQNSLNATLAARDSRKLNAFKEPQCSPEQLWSSVSKGGREYLPQIYWDYTMCQRVC